MQNALKNKLCISKRTSLFVLAMWVFFAPGYFSIFSNLKNAISIATYVISIYLVFLSFYQMKRKHSSQLMLIILFYLEMIIVTCFSDGSAMSAVRYSLPVIALCLYYETCNREKRIAIIRGLFWIHFTFAIVNLLTVLLFPNGLYTYEGASRFELYFFLGHNNVAGRFLLPGIAYGILCDYITQRRLGWKSYVTAIISFVTVCLTWSNTAMVGIGVVLVFLLIQSKIQLPRLLTVRNCLIGVFVLFFVLVVENNLGIFQNIIVNVFHKDMTLSARTRIWDAMLINVTNRPVFGYGYGVDVWAYSSMGGLEPSSGHNYILDLVFRGGIVHLAIQILIIINIAKKIDKQRTLLNSAVTIVLLAYFVMWEFEPFVNLGFRDMMLLFIIFNDLEMICYSEDECDYCEKRIVN